MTDRDWATVVFGAFAGASSSMAATLLVVRGLPGAAALVFVASVVLWTMLVAHVWKPEDRL